MKLERVKEVNKDKITENLIFGNGLTVRASIFNRTRIEMESIKKSENTFGKMIRKNLNSRDTGVELRLFAQTCPSRSPSLCLFFLYLSNFDAEDGVLKWGRLFPWWTWQATALGVDGRFLKVGRCWGGLVRQVKITKFWKSLVLNWCISSTISRIYSTL